MSRRALYLAPWRVDLEIRDGTAVPIPMARLARAVASALDATGAGDAFDAAFLAHYRRDGDLAKAAQFANDIGSWVVARYGARPPVDAELKELIGSRR